MNLLKCLCGKKPKLTNERTSDFCIVKYYRYGCEDCDSYTFATRKKEFCLENWNASMKRKTGLV